MDNSVILNINNSERQEISFSRKEEKLQNVNNICNVEDRPQFVCSFLNALQILVCQVVSLLWLPLLLSPVLCLLPADPVRVHLVSTAFLVSGVVTSLQSILGIRLPTVAVPSLLYTASSLSLLQSPGGQCPSVGDLYSMGPELRELEWQNRLRELQGALLFAGTVQTLLGFSGVQAWLTTHLLSPVSVAPAVILAGLTATAYPFSQLKYPWDITSIVAVMVLLFTLLMHHICLPLPMFSLSSGFKAKRFPVFRMFPVLWTCVAVYLTHEAVRMYRPSQLLPDTELLGYQEAVDNSKWFNLHYPFEWGLPTLSLPTVAHMLPAILLQSATSVLTFHGTANACDVGLPPHSAVSRGLGVEGLGLLLGSLWGHAVTTNPASVGLVSFTGIASRSTYQLAALLIISLSHFTRLTANLANIPIQFLYVLHLYLHTGLVIVGVSVLKFTNFKCRRDSSIVGLSLFLGLAVPQWMSAADHVAIGLPILDHLVSQSLSSAVCVSVVTGCLLDLLLPGRVSHRKYHPWKYLSEEDKECYRLPTWEELLCNILERLPFSAD